MSTRKWEVVVKMGTKGKLNFEHYACRWKVQFAGRGNFEKRVSVLLPLDCVKGMLKIAEMGEKSIWK